MKRVIILVSNPLFGQGVECLLRREAGVEVVGRETDAEKLVERIEELSPDVVVVDGAGLGCDLLSLVTRILRERVRTSVIELDPHESTMWVYHGEQRAVKEVKDLVEAIEGAALA